MKVNWGKRITDLSDLSRISEEGFDYLQLSDTLSAEIEERAILQQRRELAEGELPFLCCELPLPREVQITQKGFNLYVWTEHLKRRIELLTDYGCRYLIQNNGKARLLPLEGASQEQKEQMLQFLFILCEMAEPYGITILLEPLNQRRTNFLNTLSEVAEFALLLGKNNLSASVSLREFGEGEFTWEMWKEHFSLIKHVQLENPLFIESPRRTPRPGDGYDYRILLKVLEEIDYNGSIALPEEGDKDSLVYCKSLLR